MSGIRSMAILEYARLGIMALRRFERPESVGCYVRGGNESFRALAKEVYLKGLAMWPIRNWIGKERPYMEWVKLNENHITGYLCHGKMKTKSYAIDHRVLCRNNSYRRQSYHSLAE